MTNERTLIAALVADMAAAHDECLEGWHGSARDTLLGAMQAGNAFLATPAAPAEPIAWYSPRHGDTLTAQQKTERAAYLPLDAAAYSVPLFTGAPVALAEPPNAQINRLIAQHWGDVSIAPQSVLAFARHVLALRAAPVADDGCISVQEAWEAAGGNPGMKASKSDLLDALGMLDKVCDEADTAPVSPASVGWPDFVRRTNVQGEQR